MKKIVAFFDFDGTMIKGDSLRRFLWYYSNFFALVKKSIYLLPVLIKYVLGIMDSHDSKEKVYIIFFSGVQREKFMEKARLFSTSVIPSLVREKAVQRLKWHQKNNHDCIIVSASIEEYLLPWAEVAGFSKVLATKLEIDKNGNITGRFVGKNCKGMEKVKRIKEYLGDLKQYKIYAYGDSRGDKELLEIADHPYYKSFE